MKATLPYRMLFLLLLVCAVLHLPVIPLCIPGILLLFMKRPDEWGAFTTCVYGVFISIAFWPVLLWLAHGLDLDVVSLIPPITLATLAACVVLGATTSRRIFRCNATDLALLATLGFTALLRFGLFSHTLAPAGADMSMHSYITRLMILSGGVPGSYQPLLSLETFEAFPIGFHTLMFLFHQLYGVTILDAGLAATCLALLFYGGAAFLLVNHFFGWKEAVPASLAASFLFLPPQSYAWWGGNPTTLALAFVPLLLVGESLLTTRRAMGVVVVLAALTGLVQTHTLIFLESFYIYLLVFCALLYFRRNEPREYFSSLVLIIIAFFIINLPYLLSLNFAGIDDKVLDWIRDWTRETPFTWRGTYLDAWRTIPGYINEVFINLPVQIAMTLLMYAGAVAVYRHDRQLFAICMAFMLAIFLLILNCQYWLLPGSYLIYPERTRVMIALPLLLLAAGAVSFLLDRFGRTLRMAVLAALILLVAAASYKANETIFLNEVARQSSITPDDLEVMDFIRDNVPLASAIETNYGDAGSWIPALLARRVTDPHVNISIMYRNSNPEHGDYVFLGAKAVYNLRNTLASLEKDGYEYELLFRSNDSYLFKRMDPPQ